MANTETMVPSNGSAKAGDKGFEAYTPEQLRQAIENADLADKVRHYLAHPDARQAIAAAGHAAFHARHTWQARLTHQLLPALAPRSS